MGFQMHQFDYARITDGIFWNKNPLSNQVLEQVSLFKIFLPPEENCYMPLQTPGPTCPFTIREWHKSQKKHRKKYV